jgi:hypothetical protein
MCWLVTPRQDTADGDPDAQSANMATPRANMATSQANMATSQANMATSEGLRDGEHGQ